MTVMLTTFLVVLLVVVDQLTKYLVITKLMPINAVTVFDGILQFRYVENTGAAFGIFSDKTELLSIFTAVIILVGFIYLLLVKVESKLHMYAWIFILAGGVGNLIDRVLRGFVVDFIEVLFVDYAVFNVADCFVTIGAVLLILYVLFDTVNDKKEKSEQKELNSNND